MVRIDRPSSGPGGVAKDAMLRNRRVLTVDLKSDEGRAVVLRLVAKADVLIEDSVPASPSGSASGPSSAPRSTSG